MVRRGGLEPRSLELKADAIRHRQTFSLLKGRLNSTAKSCCTTTITRSLTQHGESQLISRLGSTNAIFSLSKNACLNDTCKNNATCQTGFTDKGYRCLCTVEFTGPQCNTGMIVVDKRGASLVVEYYTWR